MKILILGGTIFVGRHLVEVCLARGHEVTLFNRGRHGPELFPDVERIHGDRDGGLDALGGRRWDAVIDTCGYVPRVVRASARRLAEVADHYTFVSSISVYAEESTTPPDEASPVARLADPTVEAVTGETYGALKALCEEEAQGAFPGRCLIARPGLIVGPWDPTDRFTWWLLRLARGGDFLAPGLPEQPVQFIDGRDLADFLVGAIEARISDTFNLTGPSEPLSMAAFLDAARAVVGGRGDPLWVPEEIILAEGIAPFSELPLWVPAASDGFSRIACRHAVEAGLKRRSPAETLLDTWLWARELPADRPLRAGLDPAREIKALEAWRASLRAPGPVASADVAAAL